MSRLQLLIIGWLREFALAIAGALDDAADEILKGHS